MGERNGGQKDFVRSCVGPVRSGIVRSGYALRSFLQEIVSPYETDFAGKKVGIVLTHRDVDPFRSGAVNAPRTFQDMFHFVGADIVGADIVGMVYGSALEAGEIMGKPDLLKQAYELGRQLGSHA